MKKIIGLLFTLFIYSAYTLVVVAFTLMFCDYKEECLYFFFASLICNIIAIAIMIITQRIEKNKRLKEGLK